MPDTVQRELRMKEGLIAGLLVGALLVSASGPARAAGKMGGVAGGIDRSAYVAATADMGGEDLEHPTTQGGERGIGPG